MRWLSIICALFAIVTAVSAHDRLKRTVPFMDTFTSSLLGVPKKQAVTENVLLYKIPGYDDVLLKVTPKKIPKKQAVPIQIALATNSIKVNTQSQYKTCEEEASTFQKLVDLIKVGLYNKKQFLGKLLAPPPVTPIIVINEQIKYPVIQEIQKPPPPAVGVKYTETVEVDTKRMTVPLPVVTRPKQVVTKVVQPKYSYKQASQDGTMTYEFEDNPNVIVTETVAMPALPPYIQSRFEEIVSAVRPIPPGAVESGFMRIPGAVIREDISFAPPIIPGNVGHVIKPLPPVAPPIYPPAFARLQNMGYFEGGDFYGPPILVQEDIPVLLRSRTDIIKMPGSKGEVNVKVTKNKRLVTDGSKIPIEASPTKANIGSGLLSPPDGLSKAIPPPPSLTKNIDSNSGTNVKLPQSPSFSGTTVNRSQSSSYSGSTVNLSQSPSSPDTNVNLAPSSPYSNPNVQLSQSSSYSGSNANLLQSPISQRSVNSANNGISANNVVVSSEKDSSFVYKQVSNKNMLPLDISLATPTNNYNLENTNVEIDDIASRMSNYYYVPPVDNVETSGIVQRNSLSQEAHINTMSTTKPCLDVIQVTKSSACLEPYYRTSGSLKSSPIVVSDSPSFVYKQMNADGSSMNMKGNQNNVVVDVEEKTQDSRGDIPQTGFYK